MKAVWNGKVIAESSETIIVENNHYFPRASLTDDVLEESKMTSTCFWKGEAHYFSLNVEGKVNKDAAWYYPEPLEKALNIKGYVAFWKGVEIT